MCLSLNEKQLFPNSCPSHSCSAAMQVLFFFRRRLLFSDLIANVSFHVLHQGCYFGLLFHLLLFFNAVPNILMSGRAILDPSAQFQMQSPPGQGSSPAPCVGCRCWHYPVHAWVLSHLLLLGVWRAGACWPGWLCSIPPCAHPSLRTFRCPVVRAARGPSLDLAPAAEEKGPCSPRSAVCCQNRG